MADEDRTFEPKKAPPNGRREQGLGRGRRELNAQGDAAGNAAARTGVTDNPEEDWGEPVEGATYSANHATRGAKTDAIRGQGRKTRAATKDQISRR
jgi:hypothetical protein